MQDASRIGDEQASTKDETPSDRRSPVEQTTAKFDDEPVDGGDLNTAIDEDRKEQPDPATEPPSEQAVETFVKYSVFTTNEKRMIVMGGSLAAFFSPLSASIYFPALTTIAADLGVSLTNINLTVTTYLILQGIAPMMIAGFSDNTGRRPAYVICFTIYLAANLGLGLQNSYAALLVLRCLQSAGSSGTVALANGLVGDMITSAERGKYVAFASIGGLLGPSLAPIIGGLISNFLNWHWIFWFLLILAASFCVPFLLFLPETCRRVVGDGSIPPPPLNWSLTDVIRHRRRAKKGITIVFDPECGLILVAVGLTLACFYAISTGASSSLQDIYGFNTIQIALMFVPIGAGGLVSAFTTGQLIDWNYRRHAKRNNITIHKKVRQDLINFPIERARIEIALPLIYLAVLSIIGYAWTMDKHLSLAAPIIFFFLIGYSFIAANQSLNVLMVDIFPGRAAAATAANNLIRCELGAAASAAIEPMSKAMGRGWAYTTLALITAAYTPVLFLMMRYGMGWRQKKRAKSDAKKAAKKQAR